MPRKCRPPERQTECAAQQHVDGSLRDSPDSGQWCRPGPSVHPSSRSEDLELQTFWLYYEFIYLSNNHRHSSIDVADAEVPCVFMLLFSPHPQGAAT
ncbi:GM16500 [Drosophila sechellia]|uniref:GM16500 n=1 Tax=Drosophila sechellia TaxID=7238 RepID=B4II05_DROSE|nr:GM16500 [Drosophila sechellia]